MADINLNKAEFVKSAASSEGFIRDSLPRIVFAGKSNVGKPPWPRLSATAGESSWRAFSPSRSR